MVINIITRDNVYSSNDNRTMLYNTIKRAQEDIVRRIPKLETFKLSLIQDDSFGMESGNVKGTHILTHDERVLILTLSYRSDVSIETILKGLTKQIGVLKKIYD